MALALSMQEMNHLDKTIQENSGRHTIMPGATHRRGIKQDERIVLMEE